jgi:hypothetical protein
MAWTALRRATSAREEKGVGRVGSHQKEEKGKRYLISVSVALDHSYRLAVLCRGGLAVTTTLRLLHQVPYRIHLLTVAALLWWSRQACLTVWHLEEQTCLDCFGLW